MRPYLVRSGVVSLLNVDQDTLNDEISVFLTCVDQGQEGCECTVVYYPARRLLSAVQVRVVV